MAEGGEERDRRGYFKKEYKTRINPETHWRDAKFKCRYRLSKERVRSLAEDFGEYSTRTQGSNTGGGISYFEQMCLAIRYLATGANHSTIGETQQLTGATVSRCLNDVIRYFYYYHHRYIIWPDSLEEKMDATKKFYKKHKSRPLIFGLIDGTHIPIISPSKAREAVFVNRKGYYSLNTTVICDCDLRITYVNPCFAGAAHDSYCFTSSELYDDAESGGWDNFILLGDSGYGLKDYLLTPYDNPTTPPQTRYNTWHRKTRSKVERCIGVLKQRWRCLDASGGYLHHEPEKVVRIIFAWVCLHNCAIEDKEAHRDHQDVDRDRFKWRQVAPPQPDPEVHRGNRRAPVLTLRDKYVKANFRVPDPPTDTKSDSDEEIEEEQG